MKIAVFDLDGTIADTLADLADAVNYGLEILGFPIHEYEKYKYMVGNGINKLCLRALPDDKKNCAAKLHQLFNEYYSVHFLKLFSAFLCMGRCKHLGLLKSFFMCTSPIWDQCPVFTS